MGTINQGCVDNARFKDLSDTSEFKSALPEKEKIPQYVEEAVKISDEARLLLGRIQELETRLSDVLFAQPNEVCGGDATVGKETVPLASRIHSTTDIIVDARRKVESILDRIEL